MLIEKEDRLSRPSSAPRRSSGYSRRRPPRDWQKTVRYALYGLLGLLAGVAALACAALLLDHGGRPTVPLAATATVPPETGPVMAAALPPPPAPAALSPSAPPLATPATSAAVLPALPEVPPPTPAPAVVATPPAAPQPAQVATDSGELAELQAKIRAANAQLAALRAQAAQARQAAADAAAQRAAAQADAAREHATADAAQTEHGRRQAADAQAQHERDAADAEARREQAQLAQERADAAWADTERRVQALAGQASPGPNRASVGAPTVASAGALAPAAPMPAVQPRPLSPYDDALTPPPPPGAAVDNAAPPSRPRVFLHYRAGSSGALQEATEIAQRLLFSDYAYADTRSAEAVPPVPLVRYFHPEDAGAAARLAALLAWTGQDFQVQDASARHQNASRGTLEVWIGS